MRSDPARRAQIRAFQVRMLYRGVPHSTAGSLLAALVLVLALTNAVPWYLLALWFGGMCLHQVMRRIHYLRYMRTQSDPPDPLQAPRWGRRFVVAATAVGAIWGLAPLLLFTPESIGHQVVLSAICFGVCATSAAALGSYMPAFIGFVSAMMTPFVVRMALVGDAVHGYIAFAGLVVTLAAIVFGSNINQVIRHSIALRYRNDDLIEALSSQTALAETARIEAENANRAKSQFLAAASHDLRQPLHALGLFAAALHEKTREPQTQALVGSINQSVEALETLFNELLDISRLDAGAIKPALSHFPLRPILNRLRLEFGAQAKEKSLRLSIRDSQYWACSDPILLERILRNLVANAVRYTESGGVVVGCRRRGEYMSIEVWDSGIGIAEDEREHIFEEFYQIDDTARHGKKGLGLGLAIIRRFAVLLGCRVSVRSIVGGGSVFGVQVSMGTMHPAANATPERTTTVPHAVKGKLVLVVDDETSILEGMRALLSTWGCEVATGASGEAALAALGELERYPDLIVADYRLQGLETGTQVIARIRDELGFAVPAILITGTTSSDLPCEVGRADCELLYKPVVAHELQALIERTLEGRKA